MKRPFLIDALPLVLYKKVDMKLKLRLSFRDDGEGYIGTKEMWQNYLEFPAIFGNYIYVKSLQSLLR